MAEASSRSRPNTISSKQMSQLTHATPAKRNKTTRSENVAAVEQHRNRRHLKQTTQKISNLEIEVHQAMAIMDEQTVQLLNYKKLIQDPKYKNNCRTSSANEFGLLANGVGGRIKDPTNTIRFIRRKDIPGFRRKGVTCGSFVRNFRNENPRTTGHGSSLEETGSTIPVR